MIFKSNEDYEDQMKRRANQERMEQAVSFAYGNLKMDGSAVTRKDVEDAAAKMFPDPVNHPAHYAHPAKCECGRGIECIQITEHMDFVIGNIVKYAWRAGLKDSSTRLEDLRKIEWYSKRAVQREIARAAKEKP